MHHRVERGEVPIGQFVPCNTYLINNVTSSAGDDDVSSVCVVHVMRRFAIDMSRCGKTECEVCKPECEVCDTECEV